MSGWERDKTSGGENRMITSVGETSERDTQRVERSRRRMQESQTSQRVRERQRVSEREKTSVREEG